MITMDVLSYETLADRLTEISGGQVSVADLKQFENPVGDYNSLVRINSTLRGYSRFSRFGVPSGLEGGSEAPYYATFVLDVSDVTDGDLANIDTLTAQRHYAPGSLSREDSVRTVLSVLVGLYDKPGEHFVTDRRIFCSNLL